MLLRPSIDVLTRSAKNYSILVVGAGIAGPALAHFLHRYGMKPVVVERAPELRASGQTIDLRGDGREVAWRMGIKSKVLEKITKEQGVIVVDSAGRPRATFGVDDLGGKGLVSDIEILRGDLALILYNHTRKDIEYVFNDYPVSIRDHDDQVEVEFASGNIRAFDLVVGADGIRSKTRRLVFDNKSPISYLDLYTAYFTIPYSSSDGSFSKWYNAPGGRSVVLRPDNQNTTRVFLSFRSKERGYEKLDVNTQKTLLQKLFADAGFETPRILNELKNADDFYFEAIGQVKMDRWSKGRVTLVGDASGGARIFA